MIKPSYERIRFLQHQLRTAIQNHHVLLLKSRLFPQDNDIRNQMNILQSLIISMGRTQNDLLYQLQKELDLGLVKQADAQRHLSRPIPKNIPCFEGNTFSERHEKGTLRTDTPNVRCYSKKQSLLKPHIIKQEGLSKKGSLKSEESPRKGSLCKSEDGIWKNSKKLQSVLKATIGENGTFIKIDLDPKLGSVKRVHSGSDEVPPPKRRRTTESDETKSGSRSNSVSPKPAAPPRRAIESRTFTRSKKKLAAAAATAAAIAASKGTSDIDLNIMEEALKNEPIDPNIPTDDKILSNLETYEEMGQSKFLEHFSLISLSQRDAITVKKCGRKRRTVAGQSSLYNDYLKPSALSMKNPKWRYEMQPVRRASRESSIVTKKNSCNIQTEAATEEAVAEASEMAAMEAAMEDCESGMATPSEESNNAVVVETALEIDDEEDKEKEKPCVVCRLIGEGNIEVCQWCSERYHTGCLPEEARGKCPNCLAQISSIKSIVGEGGAGVSSASSLELIKRYLPT